MSFFHKNAMIGLAEVLCRLPLIFTVGYLARSIGTENFGNWVLILTFQVFVAGFAGLGLSSSLSRFVPASTPELASAYLRYAFLLCVVPLLAIGALSYGFSAPLGRLLGIKPEMDWLLPLAVLMASGGVADGYLDAYFKARMAVKRQIIFIAVRTFVEITAVVLIFVVTLPYLESEQTRLAGYIGVVAVGKLLIYPLLLFGTMMKDQSSSREQRRQFLKYGLPMVPTVLALWLVSQSDRLVLSHFVSKADLGVYVFGASLATYVVFLGYAVYPLLLPAASRLHDEGDAVAVKTLFQDAQRFFVLLWTGGMAFLALWSVNIIAWTGGEAYSGAASVLLILSFAVGFEQMMGIYQYVFHLVKRTDLIFWLNLGYAATMMLSLAAAGYYYGIALAPWAALSAILIFNVVRYWIARRYLDVPLPSRIIVHVAVLGVLTALLGRYAAHLNVGLRVVITLALLLPLAGMVFRHKADASLGSLA